MVEEVAEVESLEGGGEEVYILVEILREGDVGEIWR